MLAGLYVAYAMSRVFADDALGPAVDRARALLRLEHLARLDVEAAVNGWFVDNPLVGLLASFHYAGAHYVVTAVALVWLFRRHRPVYARARTALVVPTVLALAAYLLLPTAPPRLMAGWTDVLARHAESGWWGEAASAPQGLGWMTNQLAAFPSMHAGWALWVALAVSAALPGRDLASRAARTLAWAHAGLTGLAVVGTGNHWVLDVVAGWAVVALAWLALPTSGGLPTESGAETVAGPPPSRRVRGDTLQSGGGAPEPAAQTVAPPPLAGDATVNEPCSRP